MFKETIEHGYGWRTSVSYRKSSDSVVINQWKNGLGAKFREIYLFNDSHEPDMVLFVKNFLDKVLVYRKKSKGG
jgi:hypothetical protein